MTIVVLLAMAAAPRAAVAADASELIREGVTLRRAGNDVEALRKFQEAYELEKSPRAVAQMGLAEQALGRWVLAYEHLSIALESKTDGWIAKNRPTIADALAVVGERVGRIEIRGGSVGAEVRVDGVLRGVLPLNGALTLTTGTVTVDISAPGFVPVQRTVVVRPRQTGREYFDALAPATERGGQAAIGTRREPAAPAQPGAAPPSPPPPETGENAAKAGEPAEPGPTDGPSPARGAAKWVAWGLGAVSLGVGVYGLLGQNQAADDFDGSCSLDPSGNIEPLPGSTRSAQGCRDLRSGIDSKFRLEVIGFVGAAVFAGAGLALWLTEPQAGDGGQAALACFPGFVAGGGMALGCSFRL